MEGEKSDVQFKGVLFDFDGVLADTMRDNFNAWNSALKKFDKNIASEDFFSLEGISVMRMSEEICKKLGIDVSLAPKLLEEKDAYYNNNNSFSLYPSVEDVVSSLYKKNIPMAIVSGGRIGRIRESAPASFLGLFKTIVTAESTVRGKPFPDPYIAGARALGLDASECVVVENAPLGIQAAKSAGAYCIAIASTLPSHALSGADTVVHSFGDIRPILI